MTPEAICAVFADCFAAAQAPPAERAWLVRGGDEPLYLPAGRRRACAEVVYARDLAPSCLHEAAHWLRAGRRRRLLVDYGYWYVPDGRDAVAQRAFEAHEAEVQSLEWILARCAGVPFTISCDNLLDCEPTASFRRAIVSAITRRLAVALPARQARLADALAQASGRAVPGPAAAALAWAELAAAPTRHEVDGPSLGGAAG